MNNAALICNTSPLQYLHQLKLLSLLNQLATEIIVPLAVVQELNAGRKLGVNVPEITNIPWLSIRQPHSEQVLSLVTDLGAGEVAVLALAIENPGSVAVLDDGLAREIADKRSIPFTGTLGLLLDAKRHHFITSVAPYLTRLDQLGFRVSHPTKALILTLAGE